MSKRRGLPRRLAFAVAVIFVAVALGPYPVVGRDWGMVWFMIASPLSEMTKGVLSFEPYPLVYVLVTTLLAAMVWGMGVYLFALAILRPHSEH